MPRLEFERWDWTLRIEGVDDGNVRSWRVAERAGFTLEGVLRCQSLAPTGEPRDTRVYARTRL